MVKKENDGSLTVYLNGEVGYWGSITYDNLLSIFNENHVQKYNLLINSYGGCAYQAIAVHELISMFPCETTVVGIAASAAGTLFQAGKLRKMTANSELMIHRVWGGAFGSANDLLITAEEMVRLESEIKAIYSKKSKKPLQYFDKYFDGRDHFINAEQAISENFADILLPSNLLKQKDVKFINEIDAFNYFNHCLNIMNNSEILSLLKEQQATIKLLTNKLNKLAIRNAIEKTATDGTVLYIEAKDGEELLGKSVMILDADGMPIPAPNGEYNVGDIVLVVVDGIITETRAFQVDSKSDEEMVNEIAALRLENEKLRNALEGKAIAQKVTKPAPAAIAKTNDPQGIISFLKNVVSNSKKNK